MDNHRRLDHDGCVIGTVADAAGGDHGAIDGARSGYLQRFSSISSSFARSKAARSNGGNSNSRRSRCSSIGGASIGGDSLADGDGVYDAAFVDCATSDSGKSRTSDVSQERQRFCLATEGCEGNVGRIAEAPERDAAVAAGAAAAPLDDDARDESFKSAVSHSSQPSFGSCTSFQSRTSLGSHVSQGSQGSRRSSGAVSVKKIRAAKVLNHGSEDPHVSTIPEFAEWNCPAEPSAPDSAHPRGKRSSALSRLKARLQRTGGSGDAEGSAEKQENPPPQQQQRRSGYKYTAQFRERYEQVKDRSKFDWQGEYGSSSSTYGASVCDGNSMRLDGNSMGGDDNSTVGGGSTCREDVGVIGTFASSEATHAAPDAAPAAAAVAEEAAAAAASLTQHLSHFQPSELAETHSIGDVRVGKDECDDDSGAMAVSPTSAITPAAAEAAAASAEAEAVAAAEAAAAGSEAEVAAAMEAEGTAETAEESEPCERQVIPARFYGTSRFTAMFSQRAARRRNEKAAAAGAAAPPAPASAAESDDAAAADSSVPQSPTTGYPASTTPTAATNAAFSEAVSPTAVSMCTPTSASTGKGSRMDRSDTSEPSSSRNSSSSISSSSLASAKPREGSVETEKMKSIPAAEEELLAGSSFTELTASHSQNGGRQSSSRRSSSGSPFENMAWPTPQPKLAARISREKKRAKLHGLWALFQRML